FVFIHAFFFLLLLPPPSSTLFPYTTLFRSLDQELAQCSDADFFFGYCRSQELFPAARCHVIIPQPLDHSLPFCVDERLNFAHLADRKSTRLNSSHLVISYAVFCLKKKKKKH